MEERLQTLVGRDRRPEALSDGARELLRRLLAEPSETLAGTLEIGACGRVGVCEEAHREPDHDRLHSRLEQRHPDPHPEHEVDEPAAHAKRLRSEDSGEQPECRQQPGNDNLVRVDRGDDDEREHVVDDDDREHERPQPIGKAWPDERQ
jgi:hypothetical protein